MSLRQLEIKLGNNGFVVTEERKRELGTIIKKTYIETPEESTTKAAFVLTKIGKGQTIVSFYGAWNRTTKCGKCLLFDIKREDLPKVVYNYFGI